MPEELPDWRRKKELLWSPETPDGKRIEVGEAFARADRLSEALDFFLCARAAENVERVLEKAVEKGDWFLFRRAREFLGGSFPERAKRLAEAAEKQGKYLFALRAFEDVGDEASAEKVRGKLREVFADAPLLLKERVEEAPSEEAGEAEEEDPPGAKKKK